MKALTVWQPWASLIIAGAKALEFRGRPAPRTLRGQRIVIHAGARPIRPAEIREIRERMRAGESSLVEALALPVLLAASRLPLAAGLGTALLGEPRRATDLFPDSDRVDHHLWGWPLSEIERWEPIQPRRGFQGFWSW